MHEWRTLALAAVAGAAIAILIAWAVVQSGNDATPATTTTRPPIPTVGCPAEEWPC